MGNQGFRGVGDIGDFEDIRSFKGMDIFRGYI
jgi:hypothetical protein